MSAPFFSIILFLPSRDEGVLLSVLQQTCTEYELLVFSPSGYESWPELLRDMSEERFRRLEASLASEALKKGAENARGKYCVFPDHRVTWDRKCLACVKDALQQNPDIQMLYAVPAASSSQVSTSKCEVRRQVYTRDCFSGVERGLLWIETDYLNLRGGIRSDLKYLPLEELVMRLSGEVPVFRLSARPGKWANCERSPVTSDIPGEMEMLLQACAGLPPAPGRNCNLRLRKLYSDFVKISFHVWSVKRKLWFVIANRHRLGWSLSFGWIVLSIAYAVRGCLEKVSWHVLRFCINSFNSFRISFLR